MAVFVLSVHARYVCRQTGACCTAGWSVPIDAAREARLARAIDNGELRLPGATAVWRSGPGTAAAGEGPGLAHGADGACVFFDREGGRRCAIQAQRGHDWLPVACQQFPRVTLADDRGLHVSLSHFCPSAAALLFQDETQPLEVVEAPVGFATAALSPGLDARGHWPPLLRPGVLCTLGTWSRWERFMVRVLGAGRQAPFAAVMHINAAAAGLCQWRPVRGTLDAYAEECLSNEGPRLQAGAAWPVADVLAEFMAAREAVPRERSVGWGPAPLPPVAVAALDGAAALLDRRRVPVGRYLAARAFANWCAYQAHGVRASAAALRTALSVLLVEVGRGLAAPQSAPDDAVLLEAMRRSDWLLVHLAEGDALARHWNRAESA